jgi:hypothetical protein
VTRRSYLGLAPNALQVGDEVYLINRSKVPFVLRKSDHLNRQPRHESQMISFPIFRLIRDCYVHKIMDGEADGEACQNGGLALFLLFYINKVDYITMKNYIITYHESQTPILSSPVPFQSLDVSSGRFNMNRG